MSFLSNLQIKVLLSALIPGTLILIVVAIIALFEYGGAVLEVVEQRDAELARLTADRLKDSLDRQTMRLEATADDPFVQTLDGDQVRFSLDQRSFDLQAFDGGVAVYDSHQTPVWSNKISGQTNLPEFPVPVEFEGVRQSLQPSYSDVFLDHRSGRHSILITVPIITSDDQFNGVVAGLSSLRGSLMSAMFSESLDVTPGKEGLTYLVDGEGNSIFHDQSVLVGTDFTQFPSVVEVSNGNSGAELSRAKDGEWVISGFSPVPGTDWGVVTQQLWSEVEGPILNSSRMVLGLLLLGALIASGGIWFFIGRALRPIKDLNAGAQRIASGDFDYTIPANTGDEVQELAQQFNVMAEALKESYTELEDRVALRTRELAESEARMRAVITGAPVMILALDSDGHFTLSEGRGLQAIGFESGAWVGGSIFERDPAAPDISAHFKRALAGEEFASILNWRDYIFDVRFSPMRGPDGDIEGVIVVGTDITAFLQAQEGEQLRMLELEALFSVASIIGEPGTFDEKANRVMEELIQVTQSDRVLLRLYDPAREGQRLVAWVGPELQDPPPAQFLAAGNLLAGKAYEAGQPVVVNDYANYGDAEPLRVAQGIRSAVAVPIEVDGRILGTITANSRKADHFTPQSVRMLNAVADGTGVLLENARLLERMRASEERYRVLFDQSNDAIVMSDQGRILEANRATLDMFGYTRKEVLAMDVIDAYADPLEQQRVTDLIAQNEAVRDYATRLKKADGTEFDATITAARVYDEDGSRLGTQVILRDITEQRRQERALRESEERYRALFEQSQDTIFISRQDTGLQVNQAGLELTGYDASEISTVPDSAIFYRPQEHTRMVESLILEGAVKSFDARVRRKDGSELICQVSATALRNDEGVMIGTQGIIRDVTEQRMQALALAESEEAARRVAEENAVMAEISRIVGSSLDISLVYDRFAEQTKRLIDLDAIAILQVHPRRETFSMMYLSGISLPDRETGTEYPLEGTATAEAYHSGHPILVQAETEEEILDAYPGLKSGWDQGIRSFLAVPLISNNEVIGILYINSRSIQAFDDRDVEIARRVATQVAGSVANSLLYEEIQQFYAQEQRRAEQFRVINEVGRQITSMLELGEVLGDIPDLITRSLGYHLTTLGLIDDGDLVFTPEANPGLESEIRRPLTDDVDSIGITGWVAVHGEPLLVPNVMEDSRYLPVREAEEIRSELAVPIVASGRVMGVLDVQSNVLNQFDESDVAVLQSLAQQLGVALENAQLYQAAQRRADQFRTIGEVGRQVTSILDRDELLRNVGELASTSLGFEMTAIGIIEGDQLVFSPNANPRLNAPLYRSLVDGDDNQGLTGLVASTGEPVIIPDTDLDPRYRGAAEVPEIRSSMTVPISARGQTIGVLHSQSPRTNAFDEADQVVLQALAQEVGIAIENARLFQEQQERAEYFRIVGEIGSEMSSYLDMEEVLSRTVQLIQDTFDYYHVGIGLIEGDEVVYKFGAGAPSDNPEFRFDPARLKVGSAGLTGSVADSGEPMLVPDVSKEPRYVAMRHTNTRSELTIPIRAKGEVIGILDLQSDTVNAFDETDLVTLQPLANEAGIAIENARIFEEERRRNEQMAAINAVALNVSSVLTLDELLPHVVQLLRETFGYHTAGIFLVDEDSDEVVLQAVDSSDENMPVRGTRMTIGDEGIVGHVAGTGLPWITGDVSKDPFYSTLDIDSVQTRSELAMPIKQGDLVVGVLDFHSTREDAFDDIDMLIAQTLANQLAVAIENARIFDEARDLAVLEERNRMAREIHDTLAQGFTGIVIQLEAGEQAIEEDTEELQEHITIAKDLARQCLAEARRSVWNLMPQALEENPLHVAIADEVDQFGTSGTEKASFTLLGARRQLPAVTQAAILRICQESLNNIRKYAEASEVKVTLDFALDTVTLTVKDDGRGFDPNNIRIAEGQGGFGLTGMRQRARLLRGDVDIASAPGQGTTVQARIPTS